MAAAFVQIATNHGNGPSSPISVQMGAPQTNGNLNVVGLAWADITSTIVAVTDSAQNVYLPVGSLARQNSLSAQFYICAGIQGAQQNVVTAYFNTGIQFFLVLVAEYSLGAIGSIIDVVGSPGGGTSVAAPFVMTASVTTLNATDIVCALSSNRVNGVGSANSNGRFQQNSPAFAYQDSFTAATGAQTLSWSSAGSGTGDWIEVIASFKQAAFDFGVPQNICADQFGFHRIGLA